MRKKDHLALKTSRVESLSDGIFAIAMTILVLSFEVVAHPPHKINEQAVLDLVVGLWPDFLHYAVSFTILGVFWFQHHFQFDNIRKVDMPLLFINIASLMFVALIPFTTIMVSDYGQTRVAAMVFEANMFLAGLLFALHWEYAARKGHLLKQSVDKGVIVFYRKRNQVIPGISLLAMGISFFAPRAGSLIFLVVPLLLLVWKLREKPESHSQ